MKLEIGKTYRTRSGHTARVLAVDLKGRYSVAAVVNCEGDELLYTYTPTGSHLLEEAGSLDLIAEVKPTKRITGWVNVYKDRVHTAEIWSTRAQADSMASNSRTHVLFIDVDAEEVSHD